MIPAHQPEFDALAAHVKDALRGRPAVFIINPGNWGDSLIREGAEAFLRQHDIPYVTGRLNDLAKGRVKLTDLKAATKHDNPAMIFNGSGAFLPRYNVLPRVAELTQQFSTAVILPSTYPVPVSREDFGRDTHFFVRDRFESSKQLPQSSFCHDLAFFAKFKASPAQFEKGDFFRTDAEAPNGFDVPTGNFDVSKQGRTHTPVDRFLERISMYETIRTNRLHVGIAAVLLERTVKFYSNDYFKIKAIFDSSVEGFFPNANYHQNYDGLP